jgi:uncharacterized protein (TIGR03435 family)
MKSLAILLLIASSLPAQKFETATISPFIPSDDDSQPAREAGIMAYSNVSLKLMMTAAYGIRIDQIVGPPWLDVDRWDVLAKPPSDTDKDKVPAMLRNLLADRFHLVAHMETRPREGYALTVAKDGPKLPTVTEITGADVSVTKAGIDINGVNVSAFATMLAQFMGKPVANETNLHGDYDFRLNLTMTDLKSGSPAVATALQQLGLNLEKRDTPTEYLIVESVDRTPTPN